VVGTTSGAANKLTPDFRVDDRGDLLGGFMTTGTAGPGFVYRIAVFDRDGIKTYHGKPLARE
jgi:hypothetical protein